MVKIVKTKKEANCITHNGTMHADEVFATAFLDLYLGDVRVFRTSSVSSEDLDDDIFIYDIGRGKYDHHQQDALRRENNLLYSSVGLLWKELGKDFLTKWDFSNVDLLYDAIDKDLVEGIDGDDNGVFPKIECPYKVKTLPNVIKIFNPSFDSYQTEDEQFLRAVSLAKMIWEEEISYLNGKVLASEKVNHLLDEQDPNVKYLFLEEYLPYEEALLSNPKADSLQFVAFPSNRGGYVIKTIPKSSEDHTLRVLFPEEWAGLEEKELEKVSHIPGLKFCHTGRFIVSCSTKESAYQILNLLCQ